MNKTLPFYLRRRHVLELLGVDGRQVSKMVEAGVLNPVKLGGIRNFYLREEVLQITPEMEEETETGQLNRR